MVDGSTVCLLARLGSLAVRVWHLVPPWDTFVCHRFIHGASSFHFPISLSAGLPTLRRRLIGPLMFLFDRIGWHVIVEHGWRLEADGAHSPSHEGHPGTNQEGKSLPVLVPISLVWWSHKYYCRIGLMMWPPRSQGPFSVLESRDLLGAGGQIQGVRILPGR